jgi:hypothetical protein
VLRSFKADADIMLKLDSFSACKQLATSMEEVGLSCGQISHANGEILVCQWPPIFCQVLGVTYYGHEGSQLTVRQLLFETREYCKRNESCAYKGGPARNSTLSSSSRQRQLAKALSSFACQLGEEAIQRFLACQASKEHFIRWFSAATF